MLLLHFGAPCSKHPVPAMVGPGPAKLSQKWDLLMSVRMRKWAEMSAPQDCPGTMGLHPLGIMLPKSLLASKCCITPHIPVGKQESSAQGAAELQNGMETHRASGLSQIPTETNSQP